MRHHTIGQDQLNGSFETLLAASSWDSKRLLSKLEIVAWGWSVWFEVWHNGKCVERTQALSTAIRRYNAI